MKINIDFEILEQTKLSADEYLYLYIIYRKGFNYLQTLMLKPDLDKLRTGGYIELGETIENHIVTDKFKDLFVSNFDQMFSELLSTYPMKVRTSRGIRVLHAKDPYAKANEKSKKKYHKIVNNKLYLHKHIMNCLSKQLIIEQDSLSYLQNLETWINNHTWEKYENLDENDSNKTQNRTTRQL
jgi:hypothetical protein